MLKWCKGIYGDEKEWSFEKNEQGKRGSERRDRSTCVYAREDKDRAEWENGTGLE